MKTRIYKSGKVLAIGVVLAYLIALFLGVDPIASQRGRLAARLDLAFGHYEIRGYGLPVPYSNEYARLLQERYGIHYRQAALCIVSESLRDYVDAYDSIMAAAAERKFGKDIFRESFEEARQHWNAQHPGNQW